MLVAVPVKAAKVAAAVAIEPVQAELDLAHAALPGEAVSERARIRNKTARWWGERG